MPVSSYNCHGRCIKRTAGSDRMGSCINSTMQYRQRMSLSIENPSVQWDDVVGREQQIKVLECFGEEEALLHIVMLRRHRIDIFDAGVSIFRATPFLNRLYINSLHCRMLTQTPTCNEYKHCNDNISGWLFC